MYRLRAPKADYMQQQILICNSKSMPRDQLQRLGVEIGTAFTRKSLLGASPAVFRDLKVQDRRTNVLEHSDTLPCHAEHTVEPAGVFVHCAMFLELWQCVGLRQFICVYNTKPSNTPELYTDRYAERRNRRVLHIHSSTPALFHSSLQN